MVWAIKTTVAWIRLRKKDALYELRYTVLSAFCRLRKINIGQSRFSVQCPT